MHLYLVGYMSGVCLFVCLSVCSYHPVCTDTNIHSCLKVSNQESLRQHTIRIYGNQIRLFSLQPIKFQEYNNLPLSVGMTNPVLGNEDVPVEERGESKSHHLPQPSFSYTYDNCGGYQTTSCTIVAAIVLNSDNYWPKRNTFTLVFHFLSFAIIR